MTAPRPYQYNADALIDLLPIIQRLLQTDPEAALALQRYAHQHILSPRSAAVLEVICNEPGIDTQKLTNVFSIGRGAMTRHIRALESLGLIRRVRPQAPGLPGWRQLPHRYYPVEAAHD